MLEMTIRRVIGLLVLVGVGACTGSRPDAQGAAVDGGGLPEAGEPDSPMSEWDARDATGAADAGSMPEAGAIRLTARHCDGSPAHPPGTHVVVGGSGTDGRVAATLDGERWTDQTTPSRGPSDVGHTRNLIRGVGYGGGVFVAVGGYDNAYVSTSCDGMTWRRDVLGTNVDSSPMAPFGNFLEEVAWVNGNFVAVGGATLRLTSQDYGVTWASTGQYFDGHLRGVAVARGLAVAVGHTWGGDEAIVTTTRDGLSWSALVRSAGELYDIAAGAGAVRGGWAVALCSFGRRRGLGGLWRFGGGGHRFGAVRRGELSGSAQRWSDRELGGWTGLGDSGCWLAEAGRCP